VANKNIANEKKRKDEDVYGVPRKIVMMACCPEGEGVASQELKDGILLELGKGLGDRGNVVMTRLDDAHLKRIDALVEVEAFRSRSEAAAYFIRQGIHARKDLFDEVMPTVDKIRELKQQAKRELSKKQEQA
jgi:Arc/MetJ-type ribon-helix-helix transcriptional regulator